MTKVAKAGFYAGLHDGLYKSGAKRIVRKEPNSKKDEQESVEQTQLSPEEAYRKRQKMRMALMGGLFASQLI